MNDAEKEAQRRTNVDGIPRYITEDGRIMKYDWQLSAEVLEDNLDGESLEEHIKKLMEQQYGSQEI